MTGLIMVISIQVIDPMPAIFSRLTRASGDGAQSARINIADLAAGDVLSKCILSRPALARAANFATNRNKAWTR
jgi:hypothetical protein